MTVAARLRRGGQATLGFGGAPLGNLYSAIDDDTAQQTLVAAWAVGIRHFDTAPHYGAGLSEHRMGRFLRAQPRDDFVLSTKVGRLLSADPSADRDQFGYVQTLPFRSRFDYSADRALRSVEDSLQRLGLSRIDTVYIHDIDRRTHGDAQPTRFEEAMSGAYRALERLRREGVVRAIGLGVNETQPCLAALSRGDFDLFMVAGRCTLLDTEAHDRLIPACADRGVSLVVAGAYNSGVLATGAVPGARYDYAPASPTVLARVKRLEALCKSHGVPLRALALQFALGSDSVASVMVGARHPHEVEDAVAMYRHVVPHALWQALRAEDLVPRHVPLPAGE